MSVLDPYRSLRPDSGLGRVLLGLRECRARVRKEPPS